MARCRETWALVVAIVLLGPLFLGTPASARAATCRADNVVLGQLPALTGPTTTDWFNVFGFGYGGSVSPTLTFSAPVIPYPGEVSSAAAVSSFSVPGWSPSVSAGFKLTFRARGTSIQLITVRIAGNGGEATTVVDLALPGTSTDAPAEPPVIGLSVLFFAALTAVFALWRRLRVVC